MSRFIETIQVRNKILQKIRFHNLRFNNTTNFFYQSPAVKLEEIIQIPGDLTEKIYRCRISYSSKIENIEFIPYQTKQIHSLKLVESNDIDYSFKYADRSLLNLLFEKRGDCDDILIVKNGRITDTSTANIIFFNGEKWITPKDPLLKGTKRAQLLDEKKIEEQEIKVADLKMFHHAKLINALLDEGAEIPVNAIHS